MDLPVARKLVTDARVAVLATVNPEGHPHLVPCCFVLHHETVYSAVDASKPKSTLSLRRVVNLRANPNASLLVHQYTEDWSTLWWVRLDNQGRVVEDESERADALVRLASKYPQYRDIPPPGDVLALDIKRWVGWP